MFSLFGAAELVEIHKAILIDVLQVEYLVYNVIDLALSSQGYCSACKVVSH